MSTAALTPAELAHCVDCKCPLPELRPIRLRLNPSRRCMRCHRKATDTSGRFVTAGEQFGRLTVVTMTAIPLKGHRRALVRCQCGNEKTVRVSHLATGSIKSCGCVHPGTPSHGLRRHPLYGTWCAMKRRCLNPGDERWFDYGGRGITVCERWRNDFAAFLADMGERPSVEHGIDRINNDGHYEPGNVRWATAKEQANNRRPRSR